MASKSAQAHTAGLRRARQDRQDAILAALHATSAVILSFDQNVRNREELVIFSPDTYPHADAPYRLTSFMTDGPWGHENVRSIEEAAAELAGRGWTSMRVATDEDVMAWTSTPEFQLGAKRVAFVQASNLLRYRASQLRHDPSIYDRAAALDRQAGDLFQTDPDAAIDMLTKAMRDLPVKNPPRVYRPQKVVATLQRDTRPAFAGRGSVVGSPEDIIDGLTDYMGHRATEIFLVLFLSVRNEIVGYTEYAMGAVAGVEVHASGVFRDALVSGAAGIVTIHNHPTGVTIPSDDDRALWERLKAAGQLIGIPVVDNLVLGESSYFSEMEKFAKPLRRRD